MAVQEIKCTDCNAVLATLKTVTGIVKPMSLDITEFQLSDGPKEVACPGCGKINMVY